MNVKKLLFRAGLGIATLGVVAGGAAAFSAFEAHIVNVTATLSNALSVPLETQGLTYGTVFPQSVVDQPLTVSLASTFANQTRVTEVDYMIKQKPKCQIITPTTGVPQFAQVTEDANGHFVCPTGYQEMELLCPYLSKTSQTSGDVSIPSFHGSIDKTLWDDAMSTLYKATGKLTVAASTTNWTIDLHSPCFAGQCAQDWDSFVITTNPTATSSNYIQPSTNQDKMFGCDLWIEVNGLNGVGNH